MDKAYYAVIDINKIHTTNTLHNQERHNDRAYRMHHVDENLSSLNKSIISTGGISYTDRWNEIISQREAKQGFAIKTRSNSVIALDIVTAFSEGAEKELGINIDEWCDANKRWFEKTFGKDNILSMTLHMDETDDTPHGRRGPHIHTQVVPIDDRGRLCARSFTGGKLAMQKLHTSYANAMSEFGLSRGEKNSKLAHTQRKRWYNQVAKLCYAKAPAIKDGETFEEYKARLDEVFQDINIAAQRTLDAANKSIAHSQTRQAQIFGEYAYSINLQHIIEENFDGNDEMVNERLKNYQLIEKSVPRKELDSIVKEIMERYPPALSINALRKAKKKRHPKWEDIDNKNNNDQSALLQENIMPEEEPVKKKKTLQILADDDPTVFGGKLGNELGETLED